MIDEEELQKLISEFEEWYSETFEDENEPMDSRVMSQSPQPSSLIAAGSRMSNKNQVSVT